jgi:hypothetical protein
MFYGLNSQNSQPCYLLLCRHIYHHFCLKSNTKMACYHSLRAMRENARKGYLNGSNPKFGFMAVKEGDV